MRQLLLQLFIFFDTWMVYIILWKEFSCSLSTNSICVQHAIHIWIYGMVENRRIHTKTTTLRMHDRSSLTLTNLFTHLSNQCFHGCFWNFLFFYWLNRCNFYHGQRKWIMSLFILNGNFFLDPAVWLFINIIFFKVSKYNVPLLGLLRINWTLRWHCRHFKPSSPSLLK